MYIFHNLLQAFVADLSTEQLHHLCTWILCGHGGIDLAQSLLRSGQNEPDPNPNPNGNTPWCVCNNCTEMDTAQENVCCGNTRCKTNFEAFFLICVDHLVLTVAILNRVDIRADPIQWLVWGTSLFTRGGRVW